MSTPLIMPRQGQSVETCIITRWFRKKGDSIKEGDVLFSYETDKATFDFESPADGILLEILYNEGDEVPVLSNVAFLGKEGEEATFISQPVVPPPSGIPAGASDTGEGMPASPFEERAAKPVSRHGKTRVSPRARKLAEAKGLDYSGITGSGPQGRIVYRDVMSALALSSGSKETKAEAEQYSDQPVSNIRRLIATAMHASLMNSAQLTHHLSADARKILDARRKIKDNIIKKSLNQDITLNDIICWCVVQALKKHPALNSHYLDDRIRIFKGVNLGSAVDTARGLMVPVVKNADRMSLEMLSGELRDAAAASRKGNINPELLKSTSASFTVSNLGNYGVEMFTPVINLPQTAILGVCTITNRPADLGNNIMGFVPYIGLSLTYDHRAVDGGPATLFLREIKNEIETFSY